VWSNIQDYSHIVAHYLNIRFQAFQKHVIGLYLGVTDHWIRYEWQYRGSGHLHCLFWTESAPPLDPLTDKQRTMFAEYWGQQVTAWNPDQLRHPDARNPASLAPTDVENTADQFVAFLNRLQLHSKCSLSYCLQTKKGGGEPSCRFFYPRPLTLRPVVTKEVNHKDYLFTPACNQATLNQCSPVITMGWMANTDIQPSLSLHVVLVYLSEYVSKPAKSSVSYIELQVRTVRKVVRKALSN
jgi:ATP-dependent DNA helicase PIF1